MNQAIVSGNLTADIESRTIGENTVSKFTVAENGNRDKPLFLRVEAWNMDHLSRYLGKGSKVLVQGNLKMDQWKTKEGESRSRMVLSAQRVEFLDPAKKEGKEKAVSF